MNEIEAIATSCIPDHISGLMDDHWKALRAYKALPWWSRRFKNTPERSNYRYARAALRVAVDGAYKNMERIVDSLSPAEVERIYFQNGLS